MPRGPDLQDVDAPVAAKVVDRPRRNVNPWSSARSRPLDEQGLAVELAPIGPPPGIVDEKLPCRWPEGWLEGGRVTPAPREAHLPLYQVTQPLRTNMTPREAISSPPSGRT
jgi:hypothetical protein